MIIVETTRLVIRHLQECDVTALAALWASPLVTRFMGGPRDPQNVAESLGEDLSLSPAAKFEMWPVIEKSTGLVVGHCGLLDKETDGRQEVELVYVLAEEAWGRGFGTEAAIGICRYAKERLGLGRLVSLIDPDNQPSRRVAEKVGMTLERDVARVHGKKYLYIVELKHLNQVEN